MTILVTAVELDRVVTRVARKIARARGLIVAGASTVRRILDGGVRVTWKEDQ